MDFTIDKGNAPDAAGGQTRYITTQDDAKVRERVERISREVMERNRSLYKKLEAL